MDRNNSQRMVIVLSIVGGLGIAFMVFSVLMFLLGPWLMEMIPR